MNKTEKASTIRKEIESCIDRELAAYDKRQIARIIKEKISLNINTAILDAIGIESSYGDISIKPFSKLAEKIKELLDDYDLQLLPLVLTEKEKKSIATSYHNEYKEVLRQRVIEAARTLAMSDVNDVIEEIKKGK